MVQLAHAATGSTVTLRLDPSELGHVQIRVERLPDGTAAVHVAAERPDTLRLLAADQPQLHRALDSAGVPQEGRSLSLTLATPGDGGGFGTGGAGDGGGANGGGAASGGGNGGWRQNRTPFPAGESVDPLSTGWLRAGVDITA